MKVHYINILLFALLLNILVNTHKEPFITHHTPKIPTTRLLCECELYTPANYDNDPQMKEVMDKFSKQTQQRFEEYDERMKTTRQKCKEQCDKEIQKIILKDKLEKELTEKFATLQTDIQSDAIPTCICKKSVADKMEKGCLKCTQNLGGIVAPSSGVLAGIAEGALYVWKPLALDAAKEAAIAKGAAEGLAAGLKAGKKVVIDALDYFDVDVFFPKIFNSILKINDYTEVTKFSEVIVTKHAQNCALKANDISSKCNAFEVKLGIYDAATGRPSGPPANNFIPEVLKDLVGDAKGAATTETAKVSAAKTTEFQETYMGAVDTAYASYEITIIASIVAIVVIVLIMVIIYLILRYRRRKKMKKKLQYIKLLEE
ncbi:rifin [Plasmodium reichenowi]|uniref:Rifin n=1 Tax=Plasmodium reichenowi TaxID=5854 RepID=A0A060RR88_PLARE|nr:rifin [Plasmodium reichenowi]